MDTLIDKLKKFLAESDEDVDSALTKEQVERIEKIDKKDQKEMEENLDVLSAYTDIPDDLEEVHQFLFKQLIDQPEIEEIDKAGAKLSKTTQTQIKMALDHIKDGPKAIDILKTLLGIETKKTEKKKDDDKENLSAETIAILEEYKELKKEKDATLSKEAEKKQAETVVDLVNKALKDAGLEEIAQKKSIDDPEADKKKEKTKKGADDDDEVDLFPSIPIPVIGD